MSTIDQGTGSAATVTRIMSGAYDAGFGDMNAIIQLAGTKPGEQPVMVYMIYNKPPFALITKASSPIKTLKDVVGQTMGTPAGGSAGQLFAPLAKMNGIDASKVRRSPTCRRTCRSRCCSTGRSTFRRCSR